jgi:hypothetical protein
MCTAQGAKLGCNISLCYLLSFIKYWSHVFLVWMQVYYRLDEHMYVYLEIGWICITWLQDELSS